MCGIVGWIRFEHGGSPIDKDDFIKAMIETATRGTDATGVFTPEHGVVKAPLSAKLFLENHENDIDGWLKSDVFIGHCRAATSGFRGTRAEASNNNNNHPHEGERYVLVHNGYYGSLPIIKGYAYKGECDSELALSFIETFGIEEALSLMQDIDGFSLVVYDKQEKLVHFYRNKNPLVYAIDYDKKALLFASTSTIVNHLASYKEMWGMCVQHTTPFYHTDENDLYTVVPLGRASESKEIKLMKYVGAYSSLEDSVKGRLEIEDLFKAKSFGKYASIVSGSETRRAAVCSLPLQKRANPQVDVFTLIGQDGGPIYYQPTLLQHSRGVSVTNLSRQEREIIQNTW